MDEVDLLLQSYSHIVPQNKIIKLSQHEFKLQKNKQEQVPILGAAIGLVIINNKEIVLTHRKGVHAGWSLPGGRVEVGERFDQAFLRELEEECGLVNLIISDLLSLEHKRYNFDRQNLKLWLATFVVNTNNYPVQTEIATSEGLEIKTFKFNHLPYGIHSEDLEKIKLIYL